MNCGHRAALRNCIGEVHCWGCAQPAAHPACTLEFDTIAGAVAPSLQRAKAVAGHAFCMTGPSRPFDCNT